MVLSDNIATLIHDLKTPVIAQERVLELLLNNTFGELNESQAEIIRQIKESCRYMQNIVYSAMTSYRQDKKMLQTEKEYFSSKDLISEICLELNQLAQDNNQRFVIQSQNINIHADKFQIKRVITNLIFNAIKYADKNSNIEILSKSVDKNYIFWVKNQSELKTDPEKAFEKFESTTNSGLGLYLVKQVIEAHNGTIISKKETENKYCFGFVIPNI